MDIGRLASGLFRGVETEDYLVTFLSLICELSDALAGRIWVLDPLDSQYHLRATWSDPSAALASDLLVRHEVSPETLLAVKNDVSAEWISFQALELTQVTIRVRNRSTIRAIVQLFVKTTNSDLAELARDLAEVAQESILRHFELKATQRALETLREPIDFTANEDRFDSAIQDLIRHGSGMQFGALRTRDPDAIKQKNYLRCIALYGWDPSLDKSLWDLDDYALYPPFLKAMDLGQETAAPDRSDPSLDPLWRTNPHLDRVGSFVVLPVGDGQETFGVLSVATSQHFDLTALEVEALISVAADVGLTLSNRLNHLADLENAIDAVQLSVALNGVETVSTISHQIGSALSAVPATLLSLKKQSKRAGQNISQSDDFKALDELPKKIDELLLQLQSATAVPTMRLEECDIVDIWHAAVDPIWPRLKKLHVEYPLFSGPQVVAHVYPDALRQMFFLLLLNSLDAFREFQGSKSRTITLRYDPTSALNTSNLHTFTYTDTAGGIRSNKLRVVDDRVLALPIERRIFERGVSSKDSGTGLGLWIARQIMRRHNGGIELRDYRHGGVTFVIEIPKNLSDQSNPYKVM
jgi:signal transduction histidine kinase